MFPHGATLKIWRDFPGSFDSDGEPLVTSSSSAEIKGCAISPVNLASSSETLLVGRNGVRIDLTAYIPAGADLLYSDRVEYNGLLYNIDGDPSHWSSPYSGRDFGYVVQLQRNLG